ncbi:unnamed protein product [Rotaria magnacalcarata]|uniref:TIR domain-containing protein n=1 Tax=Rotaria magnacalcarata TaxID=392030 RepID=A0A819TTS2_9BILA|nr:unnamed protein product [Rotaria magnacalcarata]CAF4085122.1 unnamed protein product [Rotaria magnacalcarata]
MSSDEEIIHDNTQSFDEGIFADNLAKICVLKERSLEVDSKKSVFDSIYHVFIEFLNLIDADKHDFHYNLAAKKCLKLLIKSIDNIDTDKLFERDPIYALETVYVYLNLLNLPGIKTYLAYRTIDEQLYEKYILPSIIFKVLTSATKASHFSLHDLQKLNDYSETLSLILNCVQTEIYSCTTSNYSKTTTSILLFVCTYSDKTVLIPNLIKTDFVKGVAECLKKVHELHGRQSTLLINIIDNICRHEDGIIALNSLQALEFTKEIQNVDNLMNEDDIEKIVLVRMALALGRTLEQLENDRTCPNDAVDHLLQLITAAEQSQDYSHNGLHLSELLIFLMILISYKRPLEYLLEHSQAKFDNKTQSTTQFFITSFLKFHENVSNEDPLKSLTMAAFCNIFWNISRRHQYQKELKKTEEFQKLIKDIAEKKEKFESLQQVPKFIDNIEKAAKGILFNTRESLSKGLRALFLIARSSSINKNSSKSDHTKSIEPNIMISYAEGDGDICTYVYDELAKQNLEIDACIDWKYCNIDFPWQRAFLTMSNPNIILCLLSQKYYESNFDQREFIKQISDINAILICIDNTKMPEWLSQAIKKYDLKIIHFDKRRFLNSQHFEVLMQMINEYLKFNKTKRQKNPKKESESVSTEAVTTQITESIEEPLQLKSNEVTNHQSNELQERMIDKIESELEDKEEDLKPNADNSEACTDNSSIVSDASSTISEETSSDEEESDDYDLITDNGVFSDVLTKICDLIKILPKDDLEKSEETMTRSDEELKASEEASKKHKEQLQKSVLRDVYSIVVELINLLEVYEDNTESLTTVEEGLKLLAISIMYTDANALFKKDQVFVRETFYLYLNLFKLSGMKKYLTRDHMNANITMFYEKYKGQKPDCFQAQKDKRQAATPLIYIIYNISRHDDGIIDLNSHQAADLMKKWQKDSCFECQNNLKTLCQMTVALLSTPDQIKNDRKRINTVLDELLGYVVKASQYASCLDNNLMHISEPLIVLVKLINYDRTLDYILQHSQVDFDDENTSVVQFLIKLFLKFYKDVPNDDSLKETTKTALLNIFWSISLRQQYKRELLEIPEFIKIVKEIANEKISDTSPHYVPKYIEDIRKAADGIICNISETPNESEKLQCRVLPALRTWAMKVHSSRIDNIDSNSDKTLQPSKPSIMISYSHADSAFCTELCKELDNKNEIFDIWIDWKYCTTGNLWERIADGIVNSSVVLCLLSQKYYESKSCQQEFFYVFNKLKKNVIPIYIGRSNPPNHMELLMCMSKYVRFNQMHPLEPKSLGELMNMINEFLSLNETKSKSSIKEILPSLPVHYEVPTEKNNQPLLRCNMNNTSIIATTVSTIDLSQKPIAEWTKNDVSVWFQQNKVPSEICDLYDFEDGNELLMYAYRVSTEEKAKCEYQIYSQALAQANAGKIMLPHKFARFVNAVSKLYQENGNAKSLATPASDRTKPPTRHISRIPRRSISRSEQ